MNNIRFRYNKNKNTLATMRIGDLVFFGISKCRLKSGDVFNKDLGRRIALGRASLESDSVEFGNDADLPLSFHFSHLRGLCGVNKIKDLLKYFDDVDKNFYRYSALSDDSTQRLQELAGVMDNVDYEQSGCDCGECYYRTPLK